MSAGKDIKLASAGASGSLKRRSRRTTGIAARMVSTDAITRIAGYASSCDNFLWARDQRD